jgi:hypothetical protein
VFASVATAVEDDADAAAIRETLAAYRFAGEQGLHSERVHGLLC